MVIRGLVSALALAVVSGCAGIPKEEIEVFTTSYATVDEAGRAVYAEYETLITRGLGIRSSTEAPSRFGFDFATYLTESYQDREPTKVSNQLAARYTAMDAMLVFNDGLTAVVEGRGEDELRSVLAPLRVLFTSVVGSSVAAAGPVLDFVQKAISEAKSRTALVSALTAEMGPITVKETRGREVTYQGHPADVLLQALEHDARDMNKVIIGKISARALALEEKIGEAPADDASKNLYFALYEDGERALKAIRNYRALLAQARIYFEKLRTAAQGEGTIISAEFVDFAIGLRVEARGVLDQL